MSSCPAKLAWMASSTAQYQGQFVESVVPIVLRIIRNDAGQCGCAIGAEFLKGAKVSLGAGTTGGLGPRDGHGDGGCVNVIHAIILYGLGQ